MTDITELAQSEINNALAQLKQISEYPMPSTQYARVLRKYILALVEALEKAQQRIAVLEEAEQKLCAANVTLDVRAELAERQLAGLESRTVTVKLPDLRQIVSGDRYVWSDGVYNYSQDVKVVLAAAGIRVEAE